MLFLGLTTLLAMRLILAISFMLLGLLISKTSSAQSKEQVYAGIIFHIMKYVEWPQMQSLPNMTVGVLNDNQLTAALNKCAQGKKISFKDVKILKFSELASLVDCNVLFIPKHMTENLSKIVQYIDPKNILVISEKKKESQVGSKINFVEVQGKLKFELYLDMLSKSDLKVSEQLRRYAIIKGSNM